MLILAGVSINAVVGDNGVLTRTQYASFLNEMAAVEEAVQLWKTSETIEAEGEETKAIPANGLCKTNELEATERLVGEVGYYRVWSVDGTEPTKASILSSASDFNSAFESELIFYPAGVQDLYYLNNEALGISGNKTYLIDAATGMIYSMTGISLKGVRCYSSNMAKAVMNGDSTAPLFAEAEVSGTSSGEVLAGNPDAEYGFQIIADSTSNNVFKLYNNGDLYGKGIKNFSLNLSEDELSDCDTTVWQDFAIPENIGAYQKLYQGANTFFVIDNDGYLWAYGSNTSNKLGLSQEQQVDYTGREAIKLNVDGKKVKEVFSSYEENTFVITEDNSIYVAGSNINYNLGLGHNNTIYEFTKVDLRDTNGNEITGDKVYKIYPAYRYTIIWVNGSNYEVGSDNWYNNSEFYLVGHNVCGQFSNGTIDDYYYHYTKAWDGYIYKYDETQNRSVKVSDTYDATIDVQHQIKWICTGNSTVILKRDNTIAVTGAGDLEYVWFDIKSQNEIDTTRKFTPLTTSVKENLEIGTNVQKIASSQNNSNGSILIWRKNGDTDEIFGSRTGTTLGIAADKCEPGYFYKITIPSELISEGIEDIAVTSSSAYILSKTGKVYATGGNAGLGLGNENTADVGDGYIELNLSKKIKAMNEFSDKKYDGYMIFTCEDGSMLAIGNEQIILGDKILQSSWKKIASNVKQFEIRDSAAAYITKDNRIFVSGTDSYMLGIGATNSYVVNKYTEVTTFSGKAQEVYIGTKIIGLKDIDNKLYICGYNNASENYYNGLEHTTNVFELIKEDVELCYLKGYARFCISDGEFYQWGYPCDGNPIISASQSNPPTVPTKVNITLFDISDLERIDSTGVRKTTFIAGGKLYTCSNNSGRFEVVGTSGSGLRLFSYDFGENIVAGAHASELSSMYLSESGKVYCTGTKSLLGIGDTDDTTVVTKLQLSSLENVSNIVAGNGFYIAITEDGKVYGTGSNLYGILGRWIGVDRSTPNSRYKTAYEWVECPELEI